MRCCAGEQVGYLLRPENVHAVIDAGAYHGSDDHCEVAAGFEEVNGHQRISWMNIGI